MNFLKKLFTLPVLMLALIINLMFITTSPIAKAAEGDVCVLENTEVLGLPTWYKYLDGEEDSTGRCTPVFERNADGNVIVSKAVLPIGIALLEAMLSLAGLVAVVMIFIGAFRYITAQGNADNAAAARKTIINTLVGLVIVIIAASVVAFIGRSLTS